ncbi:MAG: glutaredoxin [Myxococcota bacterium]
MKNRWVFLTAIFLLSSCFKIEKSKRTDQKEEIIDGKELLNCEKSNWNDIVSSKKKVRIYTIKGCRFCRMAKELLQQQAIVYEEIDVTGDPVQRAWLREKTGQMTVPQVFFESKSIGGHSDLLALVQYPQRHVLLCSHQGVDTSSQK